MKKRHMSKNTKTVLILLVIAALIAIVPLFARKGASFGGSDDAGSVMVEEVRGEEYEVESLLFCIQTGIGVGIIAFFMGRLVERKKWMNKYKEEEQDKKENTDYAGD